MDIDSQDELETRLETKAGIPSDEHCERNLSVDNIEKIAKALEVEPSRLLSG